MDINKNIDIQTILALQSDAESTRSNFDSVNQEIADYILPRQNIFFGDKTQGDRRASKIYESTAPIALERFAATVENLLTPRSQLWHNISSVDEDLNRNPKVAAYFEKVRDILFRYRYSPRANYASQQHETYMSLGAFGTGILFIGEDNINRGIRYKSVHLSEMYFFENGHGVIDRAHRKFPIKARNFKNIFKKIPKCVQKALDNKKTEEEFMVLHVVRPREQEDTHTELEFASHYILLEEKDNNEAIISSGGYSSFCYSISRYVTAPNEVYGRSPAWTVLSDIKTINQMRKVTLRSAHKAADPAILTTDDGWMDQSPGKINPGMLDMQGREMAKPFNSGARVDFAIETENIVRGTIKDAFLQSVYELMMNRPQMTAQEVIAWTQQQGIYLSPTMGRQQSEALGVMIPREIEILDRFGLLPPPPEELTNAEIKIEYDSPLSRAQKAEFALGIQRTYEFAVPLAGIDPTIMDEFDHATNLRIVAEAQGMPQRGFNSNDKKKQIRDNRAQQQQMAAMVEAAPQLAGAVKDISAAQKLQNEVIA